MATRIVGWNAIAFAEENGCPLGVHAKGTAAARRDVSVEEAREIARFEPDRVYVDVDEVDSGDSRIA